MSTSFQVTRSAHVTLESDALELRAKKVWSSPRIIHGQLTETESAGPGPGTDATPTLLS